VDFLNPSVLDTDSTLVVANGTVLTRYNLATGKVLWTSRRVEAGPRKPCPSRAEALSGQQPSQRSDPRPLPPEISLWVSKDGRRIFATHGSTLYAVSVVEGHLLWPYPAVLCGGSAQLLEADGDVIAWTMPLDSGNDELVRLDGETGNVRWQYPAVPKGAGGFLKAFVTPDAPLSNAVVSEGSVYTLSERTIVRIDLATGISTKIGKTRVEESVGSPWLEEFQTGFLVVGQQDIEWLTREGKSTRHVHYDPVSGQGGALITLGVGAALQAAGPFQIGNRMVSIGPDYRALAGTFMHEFHASSRLDSIRIMLADLDEAGIEGPALVAIDCRTGNVLRRIPASKNPRYAIDRVRARVFIADNKTIRCYNL
jgi:hypothetical protein